MYVCSPEGISEGVIEVEDGAGGDRKGGTRGSGGAEDGGKCSLNPLSFQADITNVFVGSRTIMRKCMCMYVCMSTFMHMCVCIYVYMYVQYVYAYKYEFVYEYEYCMCLHSNTFHSPFAYTSRNPVTRYK